MKMTLKKIFRILITSIIIFVVGAFVSLLINLLAHYCPIVFVIFALIVLLVAGYIFGNEFVRK